MDVVKFADAPSYTLPDHDEVVARRLQGAEASGADIAVVGHSVFPPGAAVPMGAGPIGKVYIVTEGVLTVEQVDGTRHRLGVGDSVFVAPDEARAVRNEGEIAAAMIVVTPAPLRDPR